MNQAEANRVLKSFAKGCRALDEKYPDQSSSLLWKVVQTMLTRHERLMEEPPDEQNRAAADCLEDLVYDMIELEDEHHPAHHLLCQYFDLYQDIEDVAAVTALEQEVFSRIGYSWHPKSAEEFVTVLLKELEDME